MTRYAGDVFNISFQDPEDQDISKLMSYFPGLRNTFGKKSEGADENTPMQTGGSYATQPFAGFKPNLGAFRADNAGEGEDAQDRSSMRFNGFKQREV